MAVEPTTAAIGLHRACSPRAAYTKPPAIASMKTPASPMLRVSFPAIYTQATILSAIQATTPTQGANHIPGYSPRQNRSKPLGTNQTPDEPPHQGHSHAQPTQGRPSDLRRDGVKNQRQQQPVGENRAIQQQVGPLIDVRETLSHEKPNSRAIKPTKYNIVHP